MTTKTDLVVGDFICSMAKLVEPYDGMPDYDDFENIRDHMNAEKKEMERLREQAPDSPEEGVEGAILKFRKADGYAIYRVVDDDPLTIQHVPFGDAWKIPSAHIRGLRMEDVYKKLGWNTSELD